MKPKKPRKKNKNRICGNIKRDVIVASLFFTESGKSPVSIAKSNKQWGTCYKGWWLYGNKEGIDIAS